MKIGERGQVTIPRVVREEYGLNNGVEVEFTITSEGVLMKKSASTHPVDQTRGILKGFSKNIDQTIEELRGR